MNAIRRTMLAGLLAFVFSGCLAQEQVSNPPSGLPPDPGDAGKVTLQGIDSDGDGLRDDVQRHIYTRYSDAPRQKALTQLAKSCQAMLVATGDKAQATVAAQTMNHAVDCVFTVDPDNVVDRVEEIEGQVVNTGARTEAYATANALLSGTTFAVSQTPANVCTE